MIEHDMARLAVATLREELEKMELHLPRGQVGSVLDIHRRSLEQIEHDITAHALSSRLR